jgi:anti-sigma factor RsiW
MRSPVVCVDGVAVLMDYLEGLLSPADKAAVDAHVASCPRCVAFVESYRQTPRILRTATAADIPGDLAESLRVFLASRR